MVRGAENRDRRPSSASHKGMGEPGVKENPFWTEGFVRNAPVFREQLASLHRHPRSRQIFTDLASLLREDPARSRIISFREDEGMIDLDSYVTTALERTRQKPYAYLTGIEAIRDALTGFSDRFTFLGTPEYTEAAHGLAMSWIDYLKATPDAVINVMDTSHVRKKRKSQHVLLDDIYTIIAREADASVTARIHRFPEDWQEGKHAKLILVDDWTVRGETVQEMAAQAQDACIKTGKTSLMSQLELHLLISQPEQLGHYDLMLGKTDEAIPATVRSYYKAKTGKATMFNENGTNFSGAHSVIDFGFGDLFAETIPQALDLNGHPLLATIDSASEPELLLRDPSYLSLLLRYMHLRDSIEALTTDNPVIPELLSEASHLRKKLIALSE